MGFVPNHEFMRSVTNSPKSSWCLNNYTQRVVAAIKNQLSSLSYYHGWAKLTLDKLIRDLERHVSCVYSTVNPNILSKFEKWKEEVPKFHPTFKMSSNTQEVNELLIESFLKEVSNPRFHLSSGTSRATLLTSKPLMEWAKHTLRFIVDCTCIDQVSRNSYVHLMYNWDSAWKTPNHSLKIRASPP
jgi:hypothetical protein